MSFVKRLPWVVAVLALGLAAAPVAAANTSKSSNWAGYAVHRPRVKFTHVLGTWTQPRATCHRGEPAYSSVWIGIGGYSISSRALEQIGTEADCTAQGHESSSAWFELVPSASRQIRIPVHAHDRLRASVAVAGRIVTLHLANLTRHRSFTRRVRASVLDTTSAEWIVEAPSVCSTGTACQTLPLADFGRTGFGAARAQTISGHVGSIDDRRWTTTKIMLAQGGRHFIAQTPGAAMATATPSPLRARDSAFTVTYRGTAGGFTSAAARRVSTTRLVHRAALSPIS